MKDSSPAKSSKPAAPKEKKSKMTAQEVWKLIFKYRAAILSIPVALTAIILAFVNASRLPETVGVELLATGEYATSVGRTTAVLIPLVITAFCIMLTCLSKRIVFPWLVSAFSLVLPILIWLTNIYPM